MQKGAEPKPNLHVSHWTRVRQVRVKGQQTWFRPRQVQLLRQRAASAVAHISTKTATTAKIECGCMVCVGG